MSSTHNPTWYRNRGNRSAGLTGAVTEYDKTNQGSRLRWSLPPTVAQELEQFGRLRGTRLG